MCQICHHCRVVQAIGAEGVVAAQCRSLVKAYLPQLIKIIATMPPDQVCFSTTCFFGMFTSLLCSANPDV